MTKTNNIISVSGGKDSTALLLLAIERGTENMQAVFADTGHEHAQTYEYVQYLNDKVFPIRTIRADFTADLARKAAYVAANWKPDLMADRPGVPGYWEYVGPKPCTYDADTGETTVDDPDWQPLVPPREPSDPFIAQRQPGALWHWIAEKPPIKGMTSEEADEKIARAVAMLKPTGNPFLDLCIWKGRFPSTRARFCSEELKRNPIIEQVQMPILELGEDVISWQGVRADESPARANLPERDLVGGGPTGGSLWNYRPILQWTVDEVFAMHRKHGVDPNPLYKAGMGRVGCMPCIHARKEELREIAQRYPEEIARVAEWERVVSEASKRGCSTFFEADTIPGNSREMAEIRHDTHGIWQAVEWSKTSRGGRQFDLLGGLKDGAMCSSIYGLCE